MKKKISFDPGWGVGVGFFAIILVGIIVSINSIIEDIYINRILPMFTSLNSMNCMNVTISGNYPSHCLTFSEEIIIFTISTLLLALIIFIGNKIWRKFK